MLKQVELINFRRHRNNIFTFEPGHNVIRGLNEGGKTTILEAVCYALFGAEALRDSLADVVTWGSPERSLEVRVQIEVGDVTYRFCRGKNGAECTWPGPGHATSAPFNGTLLITGQKEVTKKAAELLGADWKLASKLMIAGQKGLAGALAEGPKATSETIEGMADFDLFQRIMDLMTENLVMGAPAQFQATLEQAQARLEAFPEPTAADVTAIEAEIATKAADQAYRRAFAEGVGKASAEAAARDLARSEEAFRARTTAETNLNAVRVGWMDRKVRLECERLNAQMGVPADQIEAQRQRVANAKNAAVLVKAHRAVTDLMARYPLDFWDRDLADLEKEIHFIRGGSAAAAQVARDADSKVRELNAKLVAGSVCGFCNQDVSQFPDVLAKNKAIEMEVAVLCSDAVKARADAAELADSVKLMEVVLKSAKPFQDAAIRYAAYVDVDESNVPPRLTWKGEVPNGDADEGLEQKRLSSLEAAQRAAEAAAADARSLERALVEDDATIARLTAQLAALPAPEDLEELKARAHTASSDLDLARYWVNELGLQIERHKGEIAAARTAYENAVKQRDSLKVVVANAKDALETLTFNNNLLAKIRKARPIISDKLWNTVLHAVSTMFTSQRGEASIVTKEKDGFKVNGKPVTSLSGSTLDLLALAIRVAMIKTFLPHCTFLVLDEPFAACDADRTSKMMGFINTAGFQQTIVITHEDASESIAENLVTV